MSPLPFIFFFSTWYIYNKVSITIVILKSEEDNFSGMPLLLRLALTLQNFWTPGLYIWCVHGKKIHSYSLHFLELFSFQSKPQQFSCWKSERIQHTQNKKIGVFPYRGASLFKDYLKLTAKSLLFTFYIKKIMFSFPVSEIWHKFRKFLPISISCMLTFKKEIDLFLYWNTFICSLK